jgi:nucleoid-associated protein YgaU
VPAVALPIGRVGTLATTHVKHHGAPPVAPVAPGSAPLSQSTGGTSTSGSSHGGASQTGTSTSGNSHGAGSHGAGSNSGGSHGAGSNSGAGASSSGSCPDVHVVRAGESLWSIAQQHVNQTGHGNTNSYWHRIYHANSQLIGANPSQISVGLHLCLPSP